MNATLDDTSRRTTSRRRLLPLAAILVLMLTGLGANPASAKPQQVPFAAVVAGTLSPTSPTSFALKGTGLATQLVLVKSYNATVQITGGDLVNGPVMDTLTETLTAPNGDSITIRCQQVAYPVSPGSPVLIGSDKWTVIAGTGHFKNASGSGTGRTVADLGHGRFIKEMTGTIAY